MTPAQFNEYQRQAEVIEQHKKNLEKQKLMTSIQWLIEKIEESKNEDGIYCTSFLYNFEIDKAKEMHKQEIIDAYFGGLNGSINDYSESKQVGSEIIDIKYGKGSEQYYNETFKKD